MFQNLSVKLVLYNEEQVLESITTIEGIELCLHYIVDC